MFKSTHYIVTVEISYNIQTKVWLILSLLFIVAMMRSESLVAGLAFATEKKRRLLVFRATFICTSAQRWLMEARKEKSRETFVASTSKHFDILFSRVLDSLL